MLLSRSGKYVFSADRIVSLDFITCYAERFQLPFDNLHGDNDYMYSEISNRKMLVNLAIKNLVIKGLVLVILENGYFYSASELGKKNIKSLKSEYAAEYRKISAEVIKKFKKMSDAELAAEIHQNAIRMLEGR